MGRVAEEPKDLLAKNVLLGGQVEQISSSEDLHAWGQFNRPSLNTLEIAAVDLLVRLYALHGLKPDWLPVTWEEQEPFLEKDLLAFLYERDVLNAEYAIPFIESCRRDRRDDLRKVMEETFKDLLGRLGRKPTWKEMLKHLPTGEGQVIQDIDRDDLYGADGGGVIYWHGKGRDRETTFKAFQKRLTIIRKKILS